MERLKGPLFGIAVVLTLWGVMMIALAVFRAYHLSWDRAIIAFLVSLAAWIFAFNFFVGWLCLRQRDR